MDSPAAARVELQDVVQMGEGDNAGQLGAGLAAPYARVAAAEASSGKSAPSASALVTGQRRRGVRQVLGHLRVLLMKNVQIKRRNLRETLNELLYPVFMVTIVALINMSIDVTQ